MGAWATLLLATRLSIYELYVLGDSKIVIDWLNRKGAILVANLEGWKDRINDLIPFFRTIIICTYLSEKKIRRLTYNQKGPSPMSKTYCIQPMEGWPGGPPTLFHTYVLSFFRALAFFISLVFFSFS
jgi:hypothetical protein